MRGLLLVVLLVVLSACGPRYETRYIYTAPADTPETTQCLQSCEFQRQQCLLIADNNYQLCESQARNEEYQCEAEARYYYERCVYRNEDNPERCRYQRGFCARPSCWRDDRRCDELYRSCYATCGGSVQAETVCTANCEDIAPAGPASVPELQPTP